jgi:hypothetical protein
MAPKRNASGGTKSSPQASNRNILITSAEGQTGRLILELLLTGEDYVGKSTSIIALVFSEEAKESLAEFEGVDVLVYDPKEEATLLEALEKIDTCMLIPPARKVSISTLFDR